MGTQEYSGIGEVKITFFIEDHMVTSRCLFFMGLSLGRWAVVSLTFSYINIMTLPLRWRVYNSSVTKFCNIFLRQLYRLTLRGGVMFFLTNGKYFLTRKNLFWGEGEISISAENCRNKIFYFFKHIFFLHNQETICLEKNIAPLKRSVP